MALPPWGGGILCKIAKFIYYLLNFCFIQPVRTKDTDYWTYVRKAAIVQTYMHTYLICVDINKQSEPQICIHIFICGCHVCVWASTDEICVFVTKNTDRLNHKYFWHAHIVFVYSMCIFYVCHIQLKYVYIHTPSDLSFILSAFYPFRPVPKQGRNA